MHIVQKHTFFHLKQNNICTILKLPVNNMCPSLNSWLTLHFHKKETTTRCPQKRVKSLFVQYYRVLDEKIMIWPGVDQVSSQANSWILPGTFFLGHPVGSMRWLNNGSFLNENSKSSFYLELLSYFVYSFNIVYSLYYFIFEIVRCLPGALYL